MNKPAQNCPAHLQRGLSLVELMIAVALGLIITLGVVNLYLSSQDGYAQTQGLAHTQETARFVDAILSRDMMVAGQMGCLELNQANTGGVNDPLVIRVQNGGGPVDLNDEGLKGWEASGTAPGDSIELTPTPIAPAGAADWSEGTGDPLPADLVGEVVAGTDVLVIASAQSLGVPINPGNPVNGNALVMQDNHNLPTGSVVMATTGDCGQGEVFQTTNNQNAISITMAGGNTDPGNDGNNFSLNYNDQTKIFRFQSLAYYVGVGANGEPALFRRNLERSTPAQELISGVESLQFLYGEDTDGDQEVDEYRTAANVDNWGEVLSIRFGLLARSNDRAVETPSNRSFSLLGLQLTPPADPDRRVRLQSTNTTAIRHRML